jgi:hypothetical protein
LVFQLLSNENKGAKQRACRPNYARLGTNLKKKDEWRNIEVHAIYALFYILGFSLEGLQVLKKFLNSNHEEIFDPLFLAQMVLSPLNTIVESLLLPLVAVENGHDWTKVRGHKNKLTVLFRFDMLSRMLGILEEFGAHTRDESTPDFPAIRGHFCPGLQFTLHAPSSNFQCNPWPFVSDPAHFPRMCRIAHAILPHLCHGLH